MNKYAGSMSNWAYQFPNSDWIFLNEDGAVVDAAAEDLLMDRVDFWRALGYDTIINTDESWEALENV